MLKKLFANSVLNILLLFIFILNEHVTNGQHRRYYNRPTNRRYSHSYQRQPNLLRSAQSCLTNLRKPGTCIPLKSCSEALHYLRNNHIQPTICSANANDRFNPTVCCGTSSPEPLTLKSGGIERPIAKQKRVSGPRLSEKKCYEQHLAAYGRVAVPTIVGGKKTYPGEFPYMAAIGWVKNDGRGYDFKCGGALISKRFVLTAAHCLSLGGSAPSVVETGGLPLNSGHGVTIRVSDVFAHPQYSSRYSYNDVGLIKLTDYAPQTPACLWFGPSINSPTNAVAVGYGTTSFAGKYSSELLKINVRTYTHRECAPYFPPSQLIPQGLSSGHICAGYLGKGRDTCQGDSGGPLIVYGNVQNQKVPFIIGITSFGQGCAGSAPGIYTKISNYLSWIESVAFACVALRGEEKIPC